MAMTTNYRGTKQARLNEEFKKQYATYKGLVTRWQNKGYRIKSDYEPPKKVTEASLRRLEKAKREIRRQKDVQEASAKIDAREAYEKLTAYVEGILDGSITSGFFGGLGGSSAGAEALKEHNANALNEVISRIFYNLDTVDEMRQFSQNYKDNRYILEDLMEKIILAFYFQKKDNRLIPNDSSFHRSMNAFENTLSEGLL